MKLWIITFAVAVFVCGAHAAWLETFDTGVGRFQYTEANGDSVFAWNATSSSLDATFSRKRPVDKRYASIPSVQDISLKHCGFSTIVTITGQLPGAESDPASAHFGFMNSAGSQWNGFLFVEAVITRPSEGLKYFILNAGDGTSGGYSESAFTIPFEFGTTYFVDAWANGPEGLFHTDFYEGQDARGLYLGSLTIDLNPAIQIGFDALGFSGWGDSQHTIIQANFDNFAFIPEPGSLALFALAGVAMRKR